MQEHTAPDHLNPPSCFGRLDPSTKQPLQPPPSRAASRGNPAPHIKRRSVEPEHRLGPCRLVFYHHVIRVPAREQGGGGPGHGHCHALGRADIRGVGRLKSLDGSGFQIVACPADADGTWGGGEGGRKTKRGVMKKEARESEVEGWRGSSQ